MARGSCGAKDPLTPRAQSKSRFAFEQRDTEESEFVDMVDCGRGGGLGSRPKKMYGERLGDGVEYHLMKPTPRR